jgi:Spy/CpxP family protein refolding chaperone
MQAGMSILSGIVGAVRNLGAEAVHAWRHQCDPWDDEESAVGCPLFQQIGVSPEQWKQLEPLLAAFRQASQAILVDVDRKRAEMYALLAAPDADRRAIAAKQEEILAGQRRMQDLSIEQLLAEKRLLSAEQQQAYCDLLRRRSGASRSRSDDMEQ